MKFRFTRRLTKQQKILLLLIVLPLYTICGSIIGNAIVQYMIIHGIIANDYYTILGTLNIIVDLGELIVVALIFKDDLINQLKDYKKHFVSHTIQGLFVGPALLLLMSIVGGLLTMALGGSDTSQNQSMIESLMNTKPLLMAIPTVLLAPVLEEIVFRGLIFTWVYEKFPKLAHIISAFLFGFVHVVMGILGGNVAEFIQIFSYFFMGMVLSYLYEKRNNIYVPILSHTVNNFIAVIMQLL